MAADHYRLSNYDTYLAGPMGPQYRRDDVGGTIRWYCYDGLGCVLGEVDQNGVLQASRTFDAYGNVRTSAGTSTSKHKFCGALGHPSEAETGLIYMRARYMDPATGAFTSEDPKRSGGNWFAYAASSPINARDSTGNDDAWINSVFNGPDWFIQGLKDAWSAGIDEFVDFLDEHWQMAVMNFAGGTSATIAGRLMLRLLVDELLLDDLSEAGEEIGDVSFFEVDAEQIGTLIGSAQDAELIDVETGGEL